MALTGCSPICATPTSADAAQDAAVDALEAAGQPVVRIEIAQTMQIGQLFYLWEFATAVAGSIIGINPFDQPDVEASKIETRKLTDAYAQSGKLPAGDAVRHRRGHEAVRGREERGRARLDASKARSRRSSTGVEPGDYVALLAYIDRNPAAIEALTRLRTRDPRRQARRHRASGSGRASCTRPGRPTRAGRTAAWCCRSPPTTRRTCRCRARSTRSAWSRRRRRAAISTCWPSAAAGRCGCISGPDVPAGLQRLAEMVERAL